MVQLPGRSFGRRTGRSAVSLGWLALILIAAPEQDGLLDEIGTPG
jgi:hypothetical protein